MMAARAAGDNKKQAALVSPRLSWDTGTAYDFFISLMVLHEPEAYGLRASWAAGVRSRLPAAERKMVEDMLPFVWVPLPWINALESPKDASSALWSLRRIPPEQRLISLIRKMEKGDVEFFQVVNEVVEKRAWNEADLEALKSATRAWEMPGKAKLLPKFLSWASRPAEFGELYYSLLQSYYQAFFEEEEKRIAPALRAGLQKAQELAASLDLPDLLVELSQGVRFEETFNVKELVLAPAYWNTPLVLFSKLDEERTLLVFGVRPAEASLVPGEQVPDALLRALKALADPTRLRILNYLTKEMLAPAELARRLRLRAPTVTHHLRELRVAGLVYLSLEEEEKKRYAARMEAVNATFANLQQYMQSDTEASGEA
ncbi:MAG: winged helix-turn-helix domain-containing protein [Anaerolineales bacterium]|nr:winged helix-turn-helix domain-containing protein [Anaerolineales bacterium]